MIYNQVLEDDQEVDLSAIKTRVCVSIRNMDDYHMELVYAIIRCYHLQIDNQPIFENPYKMKKLRSAQYRFDIDHLPENLVRILDRFVDMYEQKNDVVSIS